MRVSKFLSIITFSFFSFSSSVEASSYLSGQIGTFGTGDVDSTSPEQGKLTRLAVGYSWNTTTRIKLGLETAVSVFKETTVSKTYEPFTMWYNTPQTYNIDGSVQRFNYDLLGVFDFYATKKFDLFIKAGQGYQKKKFKSESTHSAFSSTTLTVSGFKMGLGLGYDIIKNLNLNLELSHQAGKNNHFINKATPSFGTAMLGLRYNMGG